MTVFNQILLVIQKLCRQEALHQVIVITQTVNRKKTEKSENKQLSSNWNIDRDQHNQIYTIYKRKEISQQTRTNQSENENYRQISAMIEKENTIQQKYDQIRNVKWLNREEQEMANRLQSTFNNAVARKKRKCLSLLIV